MSVMTLEDVIIEAATELAISGVCDVPVDNEWAGVDLVPAGHYKMHRTNTASLRDGVRIAIDDNHIFIFKYEGFLLAAHAELSGSVSSSVLVAIAKEWL